MLLSNRRELHRRAADSLIARSPEASPEIARHLLEARLAARAVPYLVDSGDRAARAYATEEAIAYYRQALELQAAIPESGLLRQAYEGLGAALDFANRIDEAQANYEEMLKYSVSSGDIPMRISALNKIAGLKALRLGLFPEAEQFLAEAETLTRDYNENSGVAETALIRCQMCTIQADFDSVVEHMDLVIRVGKEINSREYEVMGFEHMANSMLYLTHYDESFEKAMEGLQIAREIGSRQHEAMLLCEAMPFCQIRNGDFEAARASVQEGLEIAQRIGLLYPQAMGGYILAEIARWQGRYEEALQHGRQALEAALPLEAFMPFYVVPVLGSLGMVYVEISEKFTDQIGEFHLHALRLLESPVARIGAGSAWADLGLCALMLGDLKIAEQAIEQGLTYPNIFMRMERPRHLAGAALLSIQRGNPDLAIEQIGEARGYALERKMRQLYPLVSLVEGKALKAKGELDAAVAAFERAEEEARELGMRSFIWQACAEAASVLADSGQKDEAENKRAAARAMVAEIAALFQDQTLRKAFLENAMGKIN
jgi:tetratricopeptide (TPR) repeat protein